MPTYEVRNRRSRMVIAEVTVDEPEQVLDAVLQQTGSTIQDLAASMGGTMDEVRASLDVIETGPKPPKGKVKGSHRLVKALPPRSWSLYQDILAS